ncbi:hypothetical protein [Sphingomonas sp. PAMC 26617]|uniref:hypothetical protein n=1 Tax=Sphingomonas sp. PAMC 26617 TaxID=1112216 RepID=UPI0002890ACE|nr:hypothetical protein [Sphingomonas sp. PAMC 26617]
METVPTILLTAAIVAISAPGQAADTPKQRYQNNMTCTAVITTAIEQNALPANITSKQATSLRTVYAQQTRTTGRDAGILPADIMSDIENMHRTIVARMNASDKSKASSERAETASMTTNCAALLGFELEHTVMSYGPGH